ncbi:MAG: DUF2512 family protein [Bacillaceae bacterium]|nr:DUF2512 family protein [Bacillaceae bacterium]
MIPLNLLLKLVSIPLIIWLVDILTGTVDYISLLPYITTGIIIGGLGWTTDALILPRIGNLPAVLLDGLVAALILWGSVYMFPGSTITTVGIAITTLLIMITEFFLHRRNVFSDYAEIVEE